MQLPKSRRRQKLREKKCQYPGCGKIFYGIHISKYCTEHRQDRYRIRKRSKPENVNFRNQTIQHPYTEVTTTMMLCSLEGCVNQFEVKLYPRQYIYPKYCPEHRNDHKRKRYLEQIGREDLIELMKSESDCIEIGHGGAEESTADEDVIDSDMA